MKRCLFCSNPAPGDFALTVLQLGAYERQIKPVCTRCWGLLRDAGNGGLRHRTSGSRWWLGHGVGRFESCQFGPNPRGAR